MNNRIIDLYTGVNLNMLSEFGISQITLPDPIKLGKESFTIKNESGCSVNIVYEGCSPYLNWRYKERPKYFTYLAQLNNNKYRIINPKEKLWLFFNKKKIIKWAFIPE